MKDQTIDDTICSRCKHLRSMKTDDSTYHVWCAITSREFLFRSDKIEKCDKFEPKMVNYADVNKKGELQ